MEAPPVTLAETQVVGMMPIQEEEAASAEALSRADSVGSSLFLAGAREADQSSQHSEVPYHPTGLQSPALATTQSSLILSDNHSETSTLATGGCTSPLQGPRREKITPSESDDERQRVLKRERSDNVEDAPAAKAARREELMEEEEAAPQAVGDGDESEDRPPAQSTHDDEAPADSRKVYVSNLDYRTSLDDLREFFEQWGRVEGVFLPIHPQFCRSRGFAFVTFVDKSAAETAIAEMDGKEYDGRVLKVTWPEARSSQHTECRFYRSPTGCFNGARCRFAHVGKGKIASPGAQQQAMGPPPLMLRPAFPPFQPRPLSPAIQSPVFAGMGAPHLGQPNSQPLFPTSQPIPQQPYTLQQSPRLPHPYTPQPPSPAFAAYQHPPRQPGRTADWDQQPKQQQPLLQSQGFRQQLQQEDLYQQQQQPHQPAVFAQAAPRTHSPRSNKRNPLPPGQHPTPSDDQAAHAAPPLPAQQAASNKQTHTVHYHAAHQLRQHYAQYALPRTNTQQYAGRARS